jgi:hypothetical protein
MPKNYYVSSRAKWILQTWDGDEFSNDRVFLYQVEAESALLRHTVQMPNCPARVVEKRIIMEYNPVTEEQDDVEI